MFVKPGHGRTTCHALVVRGPNKRLLRPEGEDVRRSRSGTAASAMATWCWRNRRHRHRAGAGGSGVSAAVAPPIRLRRGGGRRFRMALPQRRQLEHLAASAAPDGRGVGAAPAIEPPSGPAVKASPSRGRARARPRRAAFTHDEYLAEIKP